MGPLNRATPADASVVSDYRDLPPSLPSVSAGVAQSFVRAGVVRLGHDGVMSVAPGMLLVATAALRDPNFLDTVVLVLDVNDDGCVGVVLNRPSGIPVADVLENWGDVVTGPEVLFRGGPVALQGALGLAYLGDLADAPLGWRVVEGRLGILDLDTPRELVSGSLQGLRIFAGYAGWGAGQLESEIAEGSWYVVAGEVDDVFADATTQLRLAVLRRQPGMLAWHATRPVEPEFN